MKRNKDFFITDWVSDQLSNCTYPLYDIVFEVNSFVLNGCNVPISAWSSECIHKTYKSIQETIKTMRREVRDKKEKLKFVAWIGGDKKTNIYPHVHCIFELPKRDIRDYEILLYKHFSKFTKRFLKQNVSINVSVREVKSTQHYVRYCGRKEGENPLRGDEKILFEKIPSITL